MAIADLETSVREGNGKASEKELAGKTALITGGRRGIGAAAAIALAKLGADVIINDIATEGVEGVIAQAQEFGVRAKFVQANITDEKNVAEMMDHLLRDVDKIDILVNNAGITRDKTFLKMTSAMWQEVLDVNLTGMFNITRLVLPGMIESGWGRVVNMASIVGRTGNFAQVNYAVSKAGVIGFTMSMAREMARKGVTVNAVAPGFIETDMTKDLPECALVAVKAMTPLGRLGRADEVANVIAFLASPRSSYITGATIPVDGGMHMHG